IRGWGEGQNALLGAAPNGEPPERGDVRSFRFASARSFHGSWSATQSGASSVGPSKHVGGKDTAVSIAEGPVRRLNALRPSHIGPVGVRIISFAVSQTVPVFLTHADKRDYRPHKAQPSGDVHPTHK